VSDIVLQGRLDDEPLPGLLHQLQATHASGVLRLETRVGRHEVYFREGFPVAVQLPGSAEMIGKVLVEMGYLDEAAHRKSLAQPPPPGVRYGEWMVQNGLLAADQLKLALKAQVRRRLHRLFFLAEGRFTFQALSHDHGVFAGEPLRVQPTRAVYQGVRSAWSAERLAGALFLLDGRAIRCTLDDQALGRYGFGQDDSQLAALLCQGYWTLPDLAEATSMPLQAVHALVYALYITDGLDVKAADQVQRLRRKSTPGVAPPPVPPRRDVSGASPLPVSMPAGVREVSGANMLPPRDAGKGAVPTPLPPGVREVSGANLLPRRDSSTSIPLPPRDSSAPKPIPQRESSGPKPVPLPPSAPRREVSGASPLPAAKPVSTDSFRREIEAKSQVVDTETLYQVLNINNAATKEEVKTAYFDAAKRYHPDRLAPLGLTALRSDVERIFRRVAEAYQTLSDDARRQAYDASSAAPGQAEAQTKAMKLLNAEMAFRRGEVALRRNDYNTAITELEAALAGNPDEGEHIAYLTWAKIAAKRITPLEGKQKLLEAIRLAPRCARAYFWLGIIYKESDIDRAYAAFRKALELDERLLDAEREIRVINMRKEKDKGGSIFDRFRKK
jgi:hypothetical protein